MYVYKEDLALNNLQWLICHKTKLHPIYLIYMHKGDLALNNTQQYKVRIKGKAEQSRERSSALPYTLVL